MGELDGVTTFCELAVPLASRIAEKFGLPHNSPQSVDTARDKVIHMPCRQGVNTWTACVLGDRQAGM